MPRKKTKSGNDRLRHMLGTTEQDPPTAEPKYIYEPKSRKRRSSKKLFTVRSRGALASKQRP